MNEKKEILVSVIIPIYDVEKYIEKCLNSAINQTLKNIEIICVNDGTPDKSMDIVEAKAKLDDRVQILTIKNSGLSVARNTGMNVARGKYIYFLDSDDWIAEDALEKLVNCAEKQQAELVYFNTQAVYEAEELKKEYPGYLTYYKRKGRYSDNLSGERLFIQMVNNRDFKPAVWLCLVNREYMEALGLEFYPGLIHEDNLFSMQLIYRAKKAVLLDETLHYRLVRAGSIQTGMKNIRHAYGYFICEREMLTTLSGNDTSAEYFWALRKFLNIMKKNAVNLVKDISMEEVKNGIRELDVKSEYFFLDYIYGEEHGHNKNVREHQENSKATGNRYMDRLKRVAKKIFYAVKRVKNKIWRMIPGDIRWYVGIVKEYGIGYFVYRKKLKNSPEKVCVSIVMPVYNAENYLPQALDSLLNQTLKNIEIICVNDGSTDRSVEILEEYQKKDSRIIVLQQENIGAGAARNYGMSIAKGEYLLFLDSDDLFDKNLCNEVYYQSIRRNAEVCLFETQRIDMQTFEIEPMNWVLRTDALPKKRVFSAKDANKNLFYITTGCPWSKMFKREFVIENGLHFQNLVNTNDAFFVRMNMIMAERITTVRKRFVTYRFNEGTNTQSTKAKAPLEFYKAFTAMKEEMLERGLYDIFEQAFCNMALRECVFNLETTKSQEAQEQIKSVLKDDPFGLLEHPEKYYRYKKEYATMKEILN